MARSGLVPNLVIMAFTAYALVQSLPWRLNAKLFPMIIGIPLLVLCSAQLILDWREKPGAKASEDDSAATVWRGVMVVGGWFLFLVLLLWIVGFPYGIPIFLVAYLMLQSKERWPLALTIALASWLLITFGLEKYMQLSFPIPLIEYWFYYG